MSLTDYIIDIALILIVFRQMRARELTGSSVILPLVLIGWAGVHYLRSFALGGNDLALIAFFTGVGLALGVLSGLRTRVWRVCEGPIMVQAGIIAAALWVAGMGFRFAFAVWANTQAGASDVTRLSVDHAITSGQVWTTALVLMAFGEVLARVGVLQYRRLRSRQAGECLISTPGFAGRGTA